MAGDQPLERYLRPATPGPARGSYKSAWLLLHKLALAMVDPDRSLLEDLVEIDEATLPFRTVKDPTAGGQPGRSPQPIAGAVELRASHVRLCA